MNEFKCVIIGAFVAERQRSSLCLQQWPVCIRGAEVQYRGRLFTIRGALQHAAALCDLGPNAQNLRQRIDFVVSNHVTV